MVIFDRVDSTNPNFPKRWLLHSVDRPTLDGSESFSGTIQFSNNIPGKPAGVHLQGDTNAGISESTDTSIFYVDGYNFEAPGNAPATGRLFARTLLPKNRIHRVIGGPGYEFMNAEYNNYPVNNKGCDPTWREQQIEHGSWRIEVEPTGTDYPRTYNTFLHVMDVGDQTTTQMVATNLIEATAAAGQPMQGTFIHGSPNKVALFAKNHEKVSSTSFVVPGSGWTEFLLADLEPNTNYYYKISDSLIDISISNNGGVLAKSSTEGTLFFETQTSSFNFVTCEHNGSLHDCDVVGPPPLPKPAKGESVTDPIFNTKITRVTDRSEIDNYSGQDGFTIRYSSFSIENSDGTYVLFEDHSNSKGWNLYNAQLFAKIERLSDLPDTVGDGGPRWDSVDPNVFYYTRYLKMYRYDVSQPLGKRITALHDFSSDGATSFVPRALMRSIGVTRVNLIKILDTSHLLVGKAVILIM